MQRSRSSSGLRLCLINVVQSQSAATLLWIWTMMFTAQAAASTPDADKTDAQDSCMQDEACHSHPTAEPALLTKLATFRRRSQSTEAPMLFIVSRGCSSTLGGRSTSWADRRKH